MIIKFILFFLVLIISYMIVKGLLDINVPKKINKYLNEKNEKYYNDLLKYYDKNKKIKLKTKLNVC